MVSLNQCGLCLPLAKGGDGRTIYTVTIVFSNAAAQVLLSTAAHVECQQGTLLTNTHIGIDGQWRLKSDKRLRCWYWSILISDTDIRTATLSPLTLARHLKAHLFGWSTAHLRAIYDALYKSTYHHHHSSVVLFFTIPSISEKHRDSMGFHGSSIEYFTWHFHAVFHKSPWSLHVCPRLSELWSSVKLKGYCGQTRRWTTMWFS